MQKADIKRGVLQYAAFDMIERGFSILPISPQTKKPMVKWRDFQHQPPSEDEIEDWQRQASEKGIHPDDMKLAIITGQLSGVVVVDCDNVDAINFCKSCDVWSPIRARTKNGLHLYFKHPKDKEYRPRAGSNSKGLDWPQFPGLDFRGDGSYAVCPPSEHYEWEFDTDIGLDDVDEWPEWNGWPIENSPQEFFKAEVQQPQLPENQGINLSSSEVIDYRSEWQKTVDFIKEKFPKTGVIPADQGNSRNDRVLHYASEQLRTGAIGKDLDERVCDFMDTFFTERLPEEEWKATCRSVEQMERTNHPERFDENGNYTPPVTPTPESEQVAEQEEPEPEPDEEFYSPDQIIDLVKDHKVEYLVEPFIRKSTIHHISGYTGQGKSTLVQMFTHASAAGRARVGPFTINRRYKTLYLNYEEGRITIRQRFQDNSTLIGPFRKGYVEDVMMYHASISNRPIMVLNDPNNRKRLFNMMKLFEPDLLVIDTIRSAYPGLDENDSKAWTDINELLVALRNRGIAVIVLHHSNKPGDKGLGSYAGSTNQLSQVELQYQTAILYEDEDKARIKGGVYDPSSEDKPSVHDRVYATLQGGRVDYKITLLLRVSVGKNRDSSDKAEDVYYIARVIDVATGQEFIHHLPTTHERFLSMYLNNASSPEMSAALMKPLSTIKEWINEYERRP